MREGFGKPFFFTLSTIPSKSSYKLAVRRVSVRTSLKASRHAARKRGEGPWPEAADVAAEAETEKKPARSSERTLPPRAKGPQGEVATGRVSLCSPRHTSAAADAGGASGASGASGAKRGGRPGAEAAQSGRPPVAGERNAGMRSEAERRRRNGGYPKAAAAEPRSGGAKCVVEEQSDTHGEGRGFIAAETLPERTQGKR